MEFVSAGMKKSGRCREVAVSEGSTVFARTEHRYHYDCISPRFLLLRSAATASLHNEEQKWKHLVRKWQTKHCTPSILITGGGDK